jgi:hypothetical protein
MTPETLRGILLSKKLNAAQAHSAIASLEALNPQADFKKRLPPGTVLLVPDTPSFKPSASTSVAGEALAGFQQLVRTAFDGAADRIKAANKERAAERVEVAEVLKTSALKRIAASDPALKEQLGEAAKRIKAEEQQDELAEEALGISANEVIAKLAELSKLLS